MRRIIIALTVVAAISTNLHAQGRFKAGLGINYVSNTYEQPHLYDYFAPSFNAHYTIVKASKFGLGIETATSLRLSGQSDEADYKTGFTSSLPVIASLNLPKISIYAGSGPAYVRQTIREYNVDERASGYYLNNLVGVGFKGKGLGDALSSEYNIRLSYLSRLSKPAFDGGMISFIVFLRG